jgi:hypothetical protein
MPPQTTLTLYQKEPVLERIPRAERHLLGRHHELRAPRSRPGAVDITSVVMREVLTCRWTACSGTAHGSRFTVRLPHG